MFSKLSTYTYMYQKFTPTSMQKASTSRGKVGMRRYGHLTIRYVSIRRGTIWLFSIRYDTDNNCKNTNIHNIHILLFIKKNSEMLRLVSFTNTVTRFTKELDKTHLFVKLKKQCTVEVLNKSVKKMTLVDFDSIKRNFCIYMYGTCRTVSCNVIILNNINDNIVNSKQYTMLDLRFFEFD